MMSQLKNDYPIVLQQDVIWGDMDAFGHVNNTVYFRYFEDARIAYFDEIGINDFKEKSQLGPILATTHCNFKCPLEYPDHPGARPSSRYDSGCDVLLRSQGRDRPRIP